MGCSRQPGYSHPTFSSALPESPGHKLTDIPQKPGAVNSDNMLWGVPALKSCLLVRYLFEFCPVNLVVCAGSQTASLLMLNDYVSSMAFLHGFFL